MSTLLRIALTYFSFVPLQRWLNWIFGALLGMGLLQELAIRGDSAKADAMALSMVAALFVAAAPLFAGGAMMRTISTPTVMNLRPQGRRHMLAGTTLAITLIALLMTLPSLVFQLTGVSPSSMGIGFSASAPSMFLIAWGGAALAWVTGFAMRRYQTLGSLNFIVVVVIAYVIVRLGSSLPLTVYQFATSVCATGLAAWIAFSIWYMNAASVQSSVGVGGWASGLFPLRAGVKNVSRQSALYQYFVGTSYWSQILLGGFMSMLLAVLPLFFPAPHEPRTPYLATGLGLMMISITFMIPQIVRRSRLLWLRAALDRPALFAAAERQAQLAVLAMLSVPLVLFLTMSLTQRPDLVLNIMLFTVLQLTFASCVLYTGLTATRGRSAGSFAASFGLLLVFVVASRSMEPDKEFSAWAYAVALAISGAMALGLRWTARHEWLALDWRVAGPPLFTRGLRGI